MTLSAQGEKRLPTDFLDGCRGLAAVYVLVGHARWLLWEGYGDGYVKHPDRYSILEKGLVYVTGLSRFGHEMVLFFFVLSGFVIHLRYARNLKADHLTAQFSGGQYFFRRARRLYPPLILAMLITYVLDHIGMRMGYPIYFQKTASIIINDNVASHHELKTAVGNLLFVMRTYVPVWGTDGPLWSLKYEWWFYMAYPMFWWLTKKSIGLATGVMIAVFAWSWLPHPYWLDLASDVFRLMPVWWLGALLADVHAGRIRWLSFSKISWLALLLPVLFVPRLQGIMREYTTGFGFAGLIAAGFAYQGRGGSMWALNKLKLLGEMSYTLYVIHLPMLVLLSGWLMSRSTTGWLPKHFGYALLAVIAAMAAAFLAHLIVERPFLPKSRRAENTKAGQGTVPETVVTAKS